MSDGARRPLTAGETRPLPAAAIFDWDGTIVDTLPLIYRANSTVLGELGIVITREWFREQYTPDWRRGYRELGVPEHLWEQTSARWAEDDWVALAPRLSLLHQGVLKGEITLTRWVEIAATTPARMFGLYPRKGVIAAGSDADIVIYDPAAAQTLSAATHHMNVDYSAYEGRPVTGRVESVLSRGEDYILHFGRGCSWFKDRESSGHAEASLRKSIDAYPAQPDPVAILRLALALDKQEKYPEALKEANHAVEITKDDTNVGKAARDERSRLVQLVPGAQAPAGSTPPK